MNKPSIKLQYLLVSFLSLGLLSACNQEKAPEDIITKAKQALLEVQSGKFDINLEVKGEGDQSAIDLNGEIASTFKKTDADQLNLELGVNLKGNLDSQEKKVDLEAAFQLISTGLDHYVNLGEFKTNDENLQFFVPLLESYKNKWLHLSEDFIPESIAGFQQAEADVVKNQQLDDLFVQSNLFTIKEDHGTEKINGHETYYLTLNLSQEGFKEYFRQVALINQVEVSEAELEELVAPLAQVKEVEVYIDTEKYYIYKATLNVYSVAPESNSTLEVNFTFNGSDFNTPIEIQTPEAAEEFNPLALPANLQGAPEINPTQNQASEENSVSPASGDENSVSAQ